MSANRVMTVDSPIGKRVIDTQGAAVTGVRLDVQKAYGGTPALLQNYINDPHSKAGAELLTRIDYMYNNLDYVLDTLDKETGFADQVKKQIKAGKKLLFKPNLVVPQTIDPATHGPGHGDTTCTEWTFMAALLRWFHDRLNINYSEMCVGDAASSTSQTAAFFTLHYGNGRTITREAVFEGRSGDFYGGWGFFFVREYLAARHPADHLDNPMNGYDESVAGRYIPPGRAGNRLMVYDLNRISSPVRGRTVFVPGGANYKDITLHKVIIGGDPEDPADMKDYPGCVLVNVPKFKIHAQDLITNAIKNIGIGLYPQEAPSDDKPNGTHWKYGSPFKRVSGMKTELPHQTWWAKVDEKTMLPLRDKNGKYVVKKTLGFPGTQADVIRATQHQGVYMLHVVDAIEAINISHTGQGMGQRVNEGFVWASLDCVALDTFCARYCFTTVPMPEARERMKKDKLPTEFIHTVPVAKVDKNNIVTGLDVDSPLFRYHLYEYCEKRGVGRQAYHICGQDTVDGGPLVSVEGHLGRIHDGTFVEILEKTLWYNPSVMLWDMQKTCLSYAQAHDKLNGTTLYKDIMAAFDEDGDGVLDYNEQGRKGQWAPLMRVGAYSAHLRGVEKYGGLKGVFLSRSYGLRYSNPDWNEYKHDFMREFRWVGLLTIAFMMSQMQGEMADMFTPSMTFGKGKWPSWPLVNFTATANAVFGMGFPMRIDAMSLYAYAFQYADKTQNGGAYTGGTYILSDIDAQNKYMRTVNEGADPMDFKVYVPAGFGSLGMQSVPNIEVTDDPAKMFTASFAGGKEVWKL